MTYGKFKKEIKKLGLAYDYDDVFISVYNPNYCWCLVAYVSLDNINIMATTTYISHLEYFKAYKLLSFCFHLARATLDERGEKE